MVKKMDSYRYLYRLLKNREYEKALKYTKNHIENNTDDERIYIYVLSCWKFVLMK